MLKKLIDTHVHIWDLKRAGYDWLKNDTSVLNRNYPIEEYDAARKPVGITNAVLVQAGGKTLLFDSLPDRRPLQGA